MRACTWMSARLSARQTARWNFVSTISGMLVSNGQPIQQRRKPNADTTGCCSQLEGRAIEELIDLPLMEDPASLATIDVLTKVHTWARFTDENLTSLLLCEAVSISLERGNCDASCLAYTLLGELVGRRFGDYQAAFRFGQLGCQLVERHGLKRFVPGTYEVFAFFIAPWMQTVRASEVLMRRRSKWRCEIGDLTMGALTWDSLNSLLFFAGAPLPQVQAEAELCLAFAENAAVWPTLLTSRSATRVGPDVARLDAKIRLL